MRRLAIIFDVDGTLCDVRSIRHLVADDSPSRNFTEFHVQSTGCPPVVLTRFLWRLAGLLRIRRVVVTARKAEFYTHTLWWLLLNGFEPDDMYMRGWKDDRKDGIVKEEILSIIRQRYRVIGAIDDNPSVIEVWRKNGIPTIQIPGWE